MEVTFSFSLSALCDLPGSLDLSLCLAFLTI